jgi:mRNA interferase RelE/StbE
MAYAVEVAPAARRQVKKLGKGFQKRIIAAIEALEENPRPKEARRLSAAREIYRMREGDYRIIYEIRDDALLVLVVKVGHRREVYRRIGSLP